MDSRLGLKTRAKPPSCQTKKKNLGSRVGKGGKTAGSQGKHENPWGKGDHHKVKSKKGGRNGCLVFAKP